MQLMNETRFLGQLSVMADRDGREHVIAVLKGTFTIAPDGLVPAEEPVEVFAADVPTGDPGKSSTRYESDLALMKPATDVVMLGHAYAPKRGTKEMLVSVRVGSVGLRARVIGDRQWGFLLGLPRMSGPKPFEKMPLTWERAFGGRQPDKSGDGVEGQDERNPCGTGYVRKGRRSFVKGLALPNLEHPKHPVKRLGQKPPPVGFGYVGRSWLPRRNFLGTYDDAWQASRMPLLPEDFDERAFCGAPAALQADPHLDGTEPVEIRGATPKGTLRFDLPGIHPTFEAHFEGGWKPLEGALDTVVIEPDESRVCLTWRARLDIHHRVRALRAVRIREKA